jgi:nucleotide-binding universal stress UspA family protein
VGFNTLLAVCRPLPGDPCVHPVAATVAELTGADVVSTCLPPAGVVAHRGCDGSPPPLELEPGRPLDVIPRAAREAGADLVALAVSRDGAGDDTAQLARTLLDAGIAVLAVPPWADRRPHVRRLGIGHDGSRPAGAALAVAHRIAEAFRGQLTRLDIAYVDDSASAAYEMAGDVLDSRREAAIVWWLTGLAEQVPAAVRPLRRVGDPAAELTELSQDLDLLVVGSRGRAPLRRAVTGSVSRTLIATARCPLLVVPRQATVG